MTFKTDDRIYETSVTTGTGDYALDGAVTGFQAFSALTANNYCPYFATDGTNWEVGIGQVLSGPARLSRTAVISSSNADAAVNWGSGTKQLRCGLPAWMAVPRVKTKSVAGSSNVTLTQEEQRCDVLILTGALTGSISVIVDATPWRWIVLNSTSGSYTLTVKVSGQTGVVVTQGKSRVLYCDATDVRDGYSDVSSNVTNNYLTGLTMSTAGSSATLSVAAGQAADSGNTAMMTLAASIGKTTSAWAVGTGNGGLDTGAIANNTWYHFYLIKRTDTGVVDVLFSLSASAPTMPTNYTLKRRIGSAKTNGSAQWTSFIQDGDFFYWLVTVLDVDALNPGTSAVTRTLTVPTGVSVIPVATYGIRNGTSATIYGLVTGLDQTDSTPSSSLFDQKASSGSGTITSTTSKFVRTNTSAQVRTRQDASSTNDEVFIATSGWIDRRGRDG